MRGTDAAHGVRLTATLPRWGTSVLRAGLPCVALVACSDRTPAGAADASVSAPPVASATAAPSASASAAESDVVSHASPVETAEPLGPSVLGAGAVDGAALRKRHIERLKTDLSPVTVLRGESALELGQRICEAVVPKKPKDTPVLLKPNLCGFDGIKDPQKFKGDDGVLGRITDPEFTRGVIRCLKQRGHTRITVAEGCGHSHAFWKQVAFVSGYDAMTREENVPLVAMDDDGVYDAEGEQPGKPMKVTGIGSTRVPTLLIPKVLAEHKDRGMFISLPKIKAHRFSVVSLSIKGMQGTVMLSDNAPYYKQKFKMHKELTDYMELRKKNKEAGETSPAVLLEERKLYVDSLRAFAERMVDVLEVSMPDVVLADGAPAMGGDGFQVLWPSQEKFAVGGTNPVLVDKVGSELLGLWNQARLGPELGGHRSSPLIDIAAKRYKLDLGKVLVAGDGADLLRSPRPTHFRALAPFSIHSDATEAWKPVSKVASTVPPAEPKAPAAPSANPTTTAGATATPGTSAPAPAAAGKREAHAAALGEASIQVDGKIDAGWERATAISWDTDFAGRTTGVATRVRFMWSRTALHALFELSGAGLNTDRSRPVGTEREGLYREDCVEIFLTPDAGSPKRYYEIELGPFGHFFDLDVASGKPDTSWSSGARIGTTQSPAERKAIIEVALAGVDVVKLLVPGARLPMGLYRMEGKDDKKYLAWSPPRTAKPNFHVPEAFGVLVIDP